MCASRNETVAPYWTVIGQVFWLCSHSAGWHFFLTEYRTVFSTFGKPLYEICSLPARLKCSSSFPQEAPNQQVGLAEELTPWGPRDRPLLAKLCFAAGQTTHHRRTGSGNVTD